MFSAGSTERILIVVRSENAQAPGEVIRRYVKETGQLPPPSGGIHTKTSRSQNFPPLSSTYTPALSSPLTMTTSALPLTRESHTITSNSYVTSPPGFKMCANHFLSKPIQDYLYATCSSESASIQISQPVKYPSLPISQTPPQQGRGGDRKFWC